MRVMMPNGNVISVKKAVTVCEQRVAFNGREVRLCECAGVVADANAIAFLTEAGVQDICNVTIGGTVLLGNLSNEFVRGVLASLVRQGYVDLIGIKLQKAQPLVSSYVLDGGASGAYILQGYEASMCCANNALGYPFMAGESPVASEAEDGEDGGEEDCADE